MDSTFVYFIFTSLLFQTYAEELPPSTCNFHPAFDTCSKIEASILSSPMADTNAYLSYTCYQAWSTLTGTCLDTTPGLFSDNCKEMCKNAVIPDYVNIGRECLTPCNGNQGSCSYCGTKGMCCTHKAGWTDTSNGCDGSFGGTTTHLCSIKKTEEIFCAEEKDCLPTESCQLKPPSEREIVSAIPSSVFQSISDAHDSMLDRNNDNIGESGPNTLGKFAQSVWLHYSRDGQVEYNKFQELKKNGWTLRNTIVVQKTVPNTFFAVIVFGGGYAGIQQLQPEHCGMTEGFCGALIFSLWNAGSNDVSLVKEGEDVQVEEFGGEGTGLRSMKLFNWQPNQKIKFEVKGTYVPNIEGWNVRCTIRIGDESHLMATLQRPGEALHEKFEFGSFIEDFKRDGSGPQTVNGCQYQRSATFLSQMIRYNDNGQNKIMKLNQALFNNDQDPNGGYCENWSCAGSTKNTFTLTTGGSRLGNPEKKCSHGDVIRFDPKVKTPNLTKPLKTCMANEN